MLFSGLIGLGSIFESVDAGDIVVIQSPISGELTWYTDPGVKYQGFGKVTIYKKRDIYSFDSETVDAGNKPTGGIEIRFNDGGHGRLFGSVQYEMPNDVLHLTMLHTNFGSQEAVEKQLVETVTGKSVYLVGPLMSSRESYAEKRNDLLHYVADQIQGGVYRTHQTTESIKDPLTGEYKTVTIAEIVTDKNGQLERQEDPVLTQFGIKTFNFTIKRLPYDDNVEGQIKQQQQIAMDVQTSIADAKKAEQRTLTVEAQGKANSAEAKWVQETIKAKEVTKAEQEKQVAQTQAEKEKSVALTGAEQRLQVAELDRKAAESTKQKDILLGEGEAQRRTLVLQADGALAQKLDAYVAVNAKYADSIAQYKGAWVPSVVMGGGNSQTGSTAGGAQDLISLLLAKTAKDLALDLSVPAQTTKQN